MTEYTFARLEDVDASAAQAAAIAAAASAAAALVSETNAATSETNADASATAAAISEANALASEQAAEAALDDFTDIYLGHHNSDPVLDNDGDALQTGALYFNDVANELRVFDTVVGWITVSEVLNTVTATSPFDDNRLVRTDTATGTRVVQQSGITVTDTDDINGVASMDFLSGATLDFNSDAIITHSAGVLDVTTGELRQGGSPVLLDGDIGTSVQAWDADLDAIAALTTTSFGRGLLELADDAALAAIVDSFFLTPAEGDALFLTPAEGNAAYQPLDQGLTDIAGLAVTDGNIIVGDGANWVAESGATARTSLGLGTGDSPQFNIPQVAQLRIVDASPTIRLLDSTASAHNFYVHANSDQFYILTDRNSDDAWETPHPLNLVNSTEVGNLYGRTILTASVTSTLTAGFPATSDNDGTQSSGTYTPDPTTGHFKHITANGAFTLAEPTASGSYTLIIQVTNGASAGAITTSAFDAVTGDTYATTNGNDYFFYITKHNGFSHLHITDVS